MAAIHIPVGTKEERRARDEQMGSMVKIIVHSTESARDPVKTSVNGRQLIIRRDVECEIPECHAAQLMHEEKRPFFDKDAQRTTEFRTSRRFAISNLGKVVTT